VRSTLPAGATEKRKMSIENKNLNLAVAESERDLAFMLPREFTPKLRQGVAVISDGRSFAFLTTRVVHELGSFGHATSMSSPFWMDDKASMVAFMRHLHGFIACEPPTYDLAALPAIGKIQPACALSAGANVVLSGTLNGARVVLKFPASQSEDQRLRWRREVEMWRSHHLWLKDVPNLIKLHAAQSDFDGVALLLFDHNSEGWVSLDDFCGAATMADDDFAAFSARLETQIGDALSAFHNNGWAFVDVHPGNIVTNGTDFLLIDIESMVELGHSTKSVVRRPGFVMTGDFKATALTDKESLKLVIEHLTKKRKHARRDK
jgi:hypothetical protein